MQISGTATTPGTASGTISVSDDVFADGTQSFSILTDLAAPSTTDDVPPGYAGANVTVTLTAADTGGSGVAQTYYTTDGTTPTTSSPTYLSAKPVLADGQSVSYFSTDNAGNRHTIRTSAPAHVDTAAPSTSVITPAAGATYERGEPGHRRVLVRRRGERRARCAPARCRWAIRSTRARPEATRSRSRHATAPAT